MSGKHCRLYDENLVHNIMISTGMSVLEFIKEHKFANTDDICEFVEFNARSIIDDTIDQLNNSEENTDKKDAISDDSDSSEEQWPFSDSDSEPKP